MKRWLWLSMMVMALGATACGTDDPKATGAGASCTVDTDCDPGFYCGAGNKCTQDCDPSNASTDACPDGFSCNEFGRCVSSGECVTNGDCDSPPDELTCDGDVLVGYQETGVCEAGTDGETYCDYAETRTPCENGCADGRCLADPCETLVCNTPPAAVCDGDTRVSYEDAGVCSEGDCDYQEVREECAAGCTNGVCNRAACDAVTCDMPPANRCDGELAIRYESTGTCDDSSGSAICDYPIAFENCLYTDSTCEAATCVNPGMQTGGVAIVEYMANPVGSFVDGNEWFEIVNLSGQAIDLTGWKITSKGQSGDEEAMIVDNAETAVPDFPADGRLLFARASDAAGGATVDFVYDGISMANGEDWIKLIDADGNVVDYVYYEPGTLLDGRSRKFNPALTPGAAENDDFTSWCPSLTDAYTSSPANYGTPGEPNTQCSVDPCADWSCVKPDDFCVDFQNAVQFANETAMCESTRLNNPRCDYQASEVMCADGTELCAYGVCETIPGNLPAPGEVIFTELMGNPTEVRDSEGEWFELYNTTATEKSLFSLVFSDNDSGGSFDTYTIIDINATIAPMSYVVFARNTNPAENGGISGAYEFHEGHLKNTPDATFELSLSTQDATVIDVPFYGPLPGESAVPTGAALQRDADGNWCAATAPYGDGDLGTPGQANGTCPN